jgi:hypothetical protein
MNQFISILQLCGLALAILINFGMGIFIYLRNRKEPIHRIFFALATSLSIWCLCIFLDLYYVNYRQPVVFNFTDRLAYVSGLFIALFFYLFSFLYPYKSSSFFKSAVLVYSGAILVFTYIIYSPLFVTEVRGDQYSILPVHNPTTYSIYSIILTVPFVFGLLQLYKKMSAGDGVYRKGFPLLITMIAIVIILSLFFNLFLAGVNNNSYISVGPISSLLFIYAIMRMIISKD